jgi:hypothetical protein
MILSKLFIEIKKCIGLIIFMFLLIASGVYMYISGFQLLTLLPGIAILLVVALIWTGVSF